MIVFYGHLSLVQPQHILQALMSDHASRHSHQAVPPGRTDCSTVRQWPCDLFKRWLCGGIQDLGEPADTELVLDWLDPFITRVERDRIVAWHLGVGL